MTAQPSGRSRHGELTLDQLVELQPGLGRLMPDVGRRYWILFYAAQGGNWELAHYQWRQLRHLFQIGATTRPKMAVHLEAFMARAMRALEEAIVAKDWVSFEKAHRNGAEIANRFHQVTGHPEIRWRLPQSAPQELDLRANSGEAPVPAPGGSA
jgi:hypothetical protein